MSEVTLKNEKKSPEGYAQVGQAVEEEEGLGSSDGRGDLVVSESHNDEDDGEHRETEQLNGLSAHEVDGRDGRPESRDESTDGEDEVTDTGVVEGLPRLELGGRAGRGGSSVTGSVQDDGRVETETVESDVEPEDRA